MMNAPFTIDGTTYNVTVPVGGLKRSFKVLDGKNAGRVLSGDMERDIIGTFYNYELQIDARSASLAEYDQLYEALSAPVNFHTVVFPYGQSTLTFQAYVTEGQDSISRIAGGKNYWRGLTIQFTSKSPQRR